MVDSMGKDSYEHHHSAEESSDLENKVIWGWFDNNWQEVCGRSKNRKKILKYLIENIGSKFTFTQLTERLSLGAGAARRELLGPATSLKYGLADSDLIRFCCDDQHHPHLYGLELKVNAGRLATNNAVEDVLVERGQLVNPETSNNKEYDPWWEAW